MTSPMLQAAGQNILAATRGLRMMYLVVACTGAGALVALLPSLALKLAVLVGVAGIAVAALMARAGRVLDSAWVLVAQLYVFVPAGSLLLGTGAQLSIITALTLGFVPFIVGAVAIVPTVRSQLVLLTPLALIGLMLAASITWSSAPDYGVTKLSIWLANCLVPAIAVFVLASARDTSWRLVLIAAVAYSVAVLVFGAPRQPGSERITLFGENPIFTGRVVLVGTVIALLGPFGLATKVSATAISVIAGVSTLSLGPIVGTGLGLVAGFIVSLRSRATSARQSGLKAVGLIVVAGLLAILVASGLVDRIIRPLVEDPNVTSRATFLAASAQLFAEAPLLGIGFGGFASTGLHDYPHNMIAEVAAETGLIGLAALTSWIVLAVIGASRSPLVMGLLVASATGAFFSGHIGSQTEFWMFSALGVAALSARRTTGAPLPDDKDTESVVVPPARTRRGVARDRVSVHGPQTAAMRSGESRDS
jgi:O-antigen ligase